MSVLSQSWCFNVQNKLESHCCQYTQVTLLLRSIEDHSLVEGRVSGSQPEHCGTFLSQLFGIIGSSGKSTLDSLNCVASLG